MGEMAKGRIAAALALSLGAYLSPTVVVARGWERPAVHFGAHGVDDVQALVVERGHVGLSLRSTHRPTLSRVGLMVETVYGSHCGVPVATPIARALVDLEDAGRVLLLGTLDPVKLPACSPPRLTPQTALTAVSNTGLPGSAGAATAQARWIHTGETLRLVWRVDPPPDLSVPTNPVFLVDDVTGDASVAVDRVRTVKVRAWPTNPIATPQTVVADLLAIDPNPAHLEGPWFAAANCIEPNSGEGWCYRERNAVPDVNGDFVYPEPDLDGPEEPQDSFAEASAYYHLDKFFAWIQGFGFQGTSCHLDGELVEIVVNRRHYDAGNWEGWDNAAFTGSCDASTLMMGQGERDFAYDGDIIYHELTHAVIETLAGEDIGVEQRRDEALVFDSTGIEEGVADFMAAAFTDDPLVAEYAFPSGGRGLDNDFLCPRDLTGESHADGQIIGGALWEAYAQYGDAFIPVVLDALAMLDDDASFEDLAIVVASLTAASLGADASDEVNGIFEARGVLDCLRVVPFEDQGAGGVHEDLGVPRLLRIRSPRMGNVYQPAPPPPIQWRIAMPEDSDTATITFEYVSYLDIPQPLALGIKTDGPIFYDYVIDGTAVEVMADTTEVFYDAEDGEVSLTADPGATVHAALLHLGTGDAATDRWLLLSDFELAFSCSTGAGTCFPPVDDETTGDEDGTGGTDEAETGGGGGCGCHSARPSGSAWWLTGLVLLGLRSRSSRRPVA
jgi:hypothetical protein